MKWGTLTMRRSTIRSLIAAFVVGAIASPAAAADCLLTETVRRPDGSPAANVRVEFAALLPQPNGEALLSRPVVTKTALDGQLSVTLLQGAVVKVVSRELGLTGQLIRVPTSASANLRTLVSAFVPPAALTGASLPIGVSDSGLIAFEDFNSIASALVALNQAAGSGEGGGGSVPDATTTTKGKVELANDGENAANVVVQGNDGRLSNQRAPTSHTHPESEVTNLVSDLAAKANASHTHTESDVTNLVSDLAAKVATGDTRLPTQAENDALVGTSGAPNSSNKYVTDADSRNTNSRSPTAHATSHNTGGSDALGGTIDSTARHSVRKNNAGAAVGARRQLDLIEGANVGISVNDDAGGEELDVTISVPDATTSTKGAVVLATPSSDTTAGHVVQANDTRLSDSRTPSSTLAHQSSHQSGGGDALSGNVDANARLSARANSTGTPSARRRFNFIAGTNMTIAQVDDGASEEVDITFTASGAGGGGVTDHGALTGLGDDDHPQYQLRSELNAANGYAGLDAGGLLDVSLIPDLAQSDIIGLVTALSGKATTAHASTHSSGGTDAVSHNNLAGLTTGDPHTQYLLDADRSAANGVASLDASTLVPAAQLPAATTSVKGAVVLATPSSDTTAGHVVQANDARLSDSRTPSSTLAHASSHSSGGGDPITHNNLAGLTTGDPHTQYVLDTDRGAANGVAALDASTLVPAAQLPAATTSVKGAVILATPSSDTTAGHVVQANDARLSDSRTPSSTLTHQSSHQSGGGDTLSGNLDANGRVAVRANSTGTPSVRRRINIIAGTNVTVAQADDSGNEEIDVTISASGGGGSSTLWSKYFAPDMVNSPMDGTWPVAAAAQTTALATNHIAYRIFDPTTANGFTWEIVVPAAATTIDIDMYVAAASTGCSASCGVIFQMDCKSLYSSSSFVAVDSSTITLADSTARQKASVSYAISGFSLSADDVYHCEMSRDPANAADNNARNVWFLGANVKVNP